MTLIINTPSIVLRSGKTLRGRAPTVLRSGKLLIELFTYEKRQRRRVTPPSSSSSSLQIPSILGKNSNQNKVHWNMSLSVIELDPTKYLSPLRKREVRIRNRIGKRYDGIVLLFVSFLYSLITC